MPLQISFELSDRDLAHFTQAMEAARAAALIDGLRRQRRHHPGIDHLMHEFALSSEEGVALMCLAEALLRIPDAATADALIRDKIGRGDWAAHLHAGGSLCSTEAQVRNAQGELVASAQGTFKYWRAPAGGLE